MIKITQDQYKQFVQKAKEIKSDYDYPNEIITKTKEKTNFDNHFTVINEIIHNANEKGIKKEVIYNYEDYYISIIYFKPFVEANKPTFPVIRAVKPKTVQKTKYVKIDD